MKSKASVNSSRSKSRRPGKRAAPRRGSAAAVLECFGKWSGSHDELRQLQTEIDRARQSDLDQPR